MNERIIEFAEQAEQHAHEQNDKYGVRFKTEYNRKFAELIVRECIKMVETEAAQYAEPVWAFELVNDMYEQWEISP